MRPQHGEVGAFRLLHVIDLKGSQPVAWAWAAQGKQGVFQSAGVLALCISKVHDCGIIWVSFLHVQT